MSTLSPINAQKRMNYQRKLAYNWIKYHRRDIFEEIEREGQKLYPNIFENASGRGPKGIKLPMWIFECEVKK